jgi:hypothetical protein
MKYLNMGCGSRFHADWENLDFHAVDPRVRVHDLRKPTAYPDETFDVVYHSHVLEHFQKEEALPFLRECFRVLKPAGILRVAVPDLENIASLYLQAMEKASRGDSGWSDNYDWMLLEMYDQTVREKSGGSSADFLRRETVRNREFVIARWGTEARTMLSAAGSASPLPQHPGTKQEATPLRAKLGYAMRHPITIARQKFLRLILGEADYRALRVGRFRAQGEIHHWMYDSYSLTRLLTAAGFCRPERRGPSDSLIPGWSNFQLDTEPDGATYKPDSLFMEAVKP